MLITWQKTDSMFHRNPGSQPACKIHLESINFNAILMITQPKRNEKNYGEIQIRKQILHLFIIDH